MAIHFANILMIYGFGVLWSLCSLCSYHVYLICVGQTTNEMIRGVYRSSNFNYENNYNNNINSSNLNFVQNNKFLKNI